MTVDEWVRYRERMKVDAFMYIRNASPYRKGDLRRNIFLKSNIDGFSIISPIYYTKYTEEHWEPSKTKDGRENPNLYWLREATRKFAEIKAKELNGVLNVKD